MTRSLPTKAPRNDIVLITVDRETLKLYGQYSSWTRSRYEGLLQEIVKQHPKVVVFDYFFGEKTKPESVDWDLIERLSGLTTAQVDDLFNRYSRRIRQNRYISSIDRDFAVLMKESGNVILPYSFHVDAEKQAENTIESGPHSIYANASQTGYVNIFPDTDGIVRTLSVGLFEQKSLAERIAQVYNPKISTNAKKQTININYFSKPYGYTMIPFQNAYNGIWKTYE
jgi:CHASE2 domain-containing sensor protein